MSWKSPKSESPAQRTLSPHLTFHASFKDITISSTPPEYKRTKAAKKQKRCAAMMSAPPEEWSEASIYDHYQEHGSKKVLPLSEVTEMVVRKHGCHKFACTFRNERNQACHSVISETMLKLYYPSVYCKEKQWFAHAVRR